MAGKHPKGTNDADGNGEKGGSLPELSTDERLDRLEALAKANGWSGLDG